MCFHPWAGFAQKAGRPSLSTQRAMAVSGDRECSHSDAFLRWVISLFDCSVQVSIHFFGQIACPVENTACFFKFVEGIISQGRRGLPANRRVVVADCRAYKRFPKKSTSVCNTSASPRRSPPVMSKGMPRSSSAWA